MSATGASDVFSNSVRLFVQRTQYYIQPTNTTGAVGGTSSFGVAATTSDNDAGDGHITSGKCLLQTEHHGLMYLKELVEQLQHIQPLH